MFCSCINELQFQQSFWQGPFMDNKWCQDKNAEYDIKANYTLLISGKIDGGICLLCST